MRRFVDISVPLQGGIKSDPPASRPEITYRDHAQTAPNIAEFFGVGVDALPEGLYAAVETCHLTTHTGTHVDAPYHYFPRMDEDLVEGGRPSLRIGEVPLEWCMQPAVKLDFRHFDHGYVATRTDVIAELERIGHRLSPLEIVVVNTSAGPRYGQDDYLDSGCGMGHEATLWLLQQGVRMVGTDAWSWDAPFSHTRERVRQSGNASLIWEGHRAGRNIGYSQIEKLSNLEKLPSTGFEIACFPVHVKDASAGWTRAVAIFDE